jgi:hypothetical protein
LLSTLSSIPWQISTFAVSAQAVTTLALPGDERRNHPLAGSADPIIAPLSREVGLAEWQIGAMISAAAIMSVATSQSCPLWSYRRCEPLHACRLPVPKRSVRTFRPDHHRQGVVWVPILSQACDPGVVWTSAQGGAPTLECVQVAGHRS